MVQTGQQQIDGVWYYLDGSGVMQTGWQQIGGSWYYFSGSGAMRTGWVGDDSAWYYLDPASGIMYTSTQITVDQVTYQVDGNGVCVAVTGNDGRNTGNADTSNGQEADNRPAPENTPAGNVSPGPGSGAAGDGNQNGTSSIVAGGHSGSGSTSGGPGDKAPDGTYIAPFEG